MRVVAQRRLPRRLSRKGAPIPTGPGDTRPRAFRRALLGRLDPRRAPPVPGARLPAGISAERARLAAFERLDLIRAPLRGHRPALRRAVTSPCPPSGAAECKSLERVWGQSGPREPAPRSGYRIG
jgi:hypothetical protein